MEYTAHSYTAAWNKDQGIFLCKWVGNSVYSKETETFVNPFLRMSLLFLCIIQKDKYNFTARYETTSVTESLNKPLWY